MNKTINGLIFLTMTMLFTITACAQQQINLDDWDEQAKSNIRLLPKYGHIPKTKEQKEADQRFIEVEQERFKGDRTAASNKLISHGFEYLYRGDIKTAMYRFNQAYLLDSLNNNIYWGYGAVYMTLEKFEKAKQQYEEGLSINPNNTHLLTDYGNYFMVQSNELAPTYENAELASSYLDSAITYLLKSYQLDKLNQNTTFKLSVCFLHKYDCDNAWKYYDECEVLGGQPITEEYTKYLTDRCEQKK